MSDPELRRPAWLLPMGRVHPMWWLPVGVAVIWLDYWLVPARQFPVIYLIPIVIAAWYSGRRPAAALAVTVPVAHALFLYLGPPPEGFSFLLLIPTAFRGVVILFLALWLARLAEHERKVHSYVERLEGLLPICAFCKSIRNKSGEWEPLESYISSRSDAEFSHSFCKNCGKLHYPDFDYDGEAEATKKDAAV